MGTGVQGLVRDGLVGSEESFGEECLSVIYKTEDAKLSEGE